jgi:hypothetical protein
MSYAEACPVLQTGQWSCHDADGREIPCGGSGQDAEFRRGLAWPSPRFDAQGEVVRDRLTGLIWTRDASPGELPMTWREALDFIVRLNRDSHLGYNDWRLPNRRELRSLVSHQTRRLALPEDHPFINVFSGWYWTSTTAAISPTHAWYVNLDGARLFYGGKDQSYLVWPVRGESSVLPTTGQTQCFDANGREIACAGTGQDGEFRAGVPWPVPRFTAQGDKVFDRLTGLYWMHRADLAHRAVNWREALAAVAVHNRAGAKPHESWRLPNINELESLVDCTAHSPALSPGHPFEEVQAAYWSSTTSLFEPDWAWALYLDKGAVGVGQKHGWHFHVWAVCGGVGNDLA